MTERLYEAPSIVEIGTLHELTLANKDFTGSDGVNLIIPPNNPLGLPPGTIPLGPAS
jgi:hypothetical protein